MCSCMSPYTPHRVTANASEHKSWYLPLPRIGHDVRRPDCREQCVDVPITGKRLVDVDGRDRRDLG